MSELIIIGDRVLIEPQEGEQHTDAGLVLPATVTEKEKVQSGKVVRVGPGYIVPNPDFSEGEDWSASTPEEIRYLPLQAKPGDFAFFLRKEAIEIKYRSKPYSIISHGAILALVRPDPEEALDDIETLLDLD